MERSSCWGLPNLSRTTSLIWSSQSTKAAASRTSWTISDLNLNLSLKPFNLRSKKIYCSVTLPLLVDVPCPSSLSTSTYNHLVALDLNRMHILVLVSVSFTHSQKNVKKYTRCLTRLCLFINLYSILAENETYEDFSQFSLISFPYQCDHWFTMLIWKTASGNQYPPLFTAVFSSVSEYR